MDECHAVSPHKTTSSGVCLINEQHPTPHRKQIPNANPRTQLSEHDHLRRCPLSRKATFKSTGLGNGLTSNAAQDYEIHGGSRYCGFQFQNVGQLIGMWDTREIITGLPYDFSHLITTHFAAFYKKHITTFVLSQQEREALGISEEEYIRANTGRLGRKMEESMKHYKADISVRRVGIITAPRLPPDHPSVRHSSCLHREVFPAADITEARQNAIALVKYPNTPEFLNCLNFYYRAVQNA